MKAAIPVNGQASTALGLNLRKVVIKQMVPERGVAICEDSVNNSTEVPYRVQRAKGRIPQVGEVWYVDRSMGPWTFLAFVAADDSAFTTAEDQFTFSQGLVLPDGKQLLVGVVPSSVTATIASRRANATDAVLAFGVGSDANSRFTVASDGKIEWGPGGSTSRDTNLYRVSPNVLATDDSLAVGASLTVTTSVTKVSQTWQTPSYSTGWAGTTTFNGVGGPTLRYRIDAEDNLWLYGLFKNTTTTPSNPIFVLPSAWQPAAGGWIFVQRNNGGTLAVGTAFVSSSGNIDLFAGQGMLFPSGISGVEYFFNGKV